jgi:type IV pilus assembly protein PilA
MLKRLRERAGSESGFTLIELLVVMLILGILAAIAIPAFLNQKNKANDASAKSMARTMQTAEETCSTDNNGSYANCTLAALQAIEPTIAASGSVSAVTVPANTATGYTVQANSSTGNTFSITRAASGATTRACVVASGGNAGGCQSGGTW